MSATGPTCNKCPSTALAVTKWKPIGASAPLLFVYCDECGSTVGVLDPESLAGAATQLANLNRAAVGSVIEHLDARLRAIETGVKKA
ncbi:MAG TPA: hypothetical protein VK733_04115 [Gemmatimonadaceae bacterium]|jgi:hypothetical protein|nr:hypothetical protein [Gemmatimonadaceae bacterium]